MHRCFSSAPIPITTDTGHAWMGHGYCHLIQVDRRSACFHTQALSALGFRGMRANAWPLGSWMSVPARCGIPETLLPAVHTDHLVNKVQCEVAPVMHCSAPPSIGSLRLTARRSATVLLPVATHAHFPSNSFRMFRRVEPSIGFTTCRSKPASSESRRSSSCPQPESAMIVAPLAHAVVRIRRQAS